MFTLTAGDGSRLHGFCRRFLPSLVLGVQQDAKGKTPPRVRLPVVVCLITQYMWCDFMHKVWLQMNTEGLCLRTMVVHIWVHTVVFHVPLVVVVAVSIR